MDSVEIFVEILAESWNNNDSLVRILKSAPEYLSNIPGSDCGKNKIFKKLKRTLHYFLITCKNFLLEKALELIFNDTRGLFKLIERILLMSKLEMNKFTSSLQESFIALQFIMECFQQSFEPYISKTLVNLISTIKNIKYFFYQFYCPL